MASIDKRANSWSVRWCNRDGTSGRKSGFATEKAAEAYRRRVEDAIAADGVWVVEAPRRRARWRDVAEAWVIWAAPRVAPSTIAAKATSLDDFERWWGSHAIPTVEDIETYHGDIISRGLSHGTALNRCTTVRQVVAWAARRQEWRRDVADPGRLSLPPAPAGTPTRGLTWAEMDAVILAARARGDWEADLLHVLRCTGLRLSQAMHLRWEDVDLEAATLTIRRDLPGSKSAAEKRGRWMPIASHLAADMAGWGRREGWLIHRHGGRWSAGPTVARDDVRDVREEALRPIYEAAGVDVGRQVTHAWRKGFRTSMLLLGAPDAHLKYFMGRRGDLDHETYTDWLLMEPHLRSTIELVPPVAAQADVVALDVERRRRAR